MSEQNPPPGDVQSERQAAKWAGGEGVAYTERNPRTVAEMNELKREAYGISQAAIHDRCLSSISDSLTVLEVGTNVGIQLEILRRLGYRDLTGVDVSRYAVAEGRRRRPDLDLLLAAGQQLPFRDDEFDLVFTVGMLVTIPPDEIDIVIDELVRVSNRYVYGLEFHADEYTRIENRGLYWKTDFVDRFVSRHDLDVVEREYLSYEDEDVRDVVYLLERP